MSDRSQSPSSKDFFISYNRFDQSWAEWIAWILEEAGYSVVIQAWDFRPGGNFVLDMQRAAAESHKTIALLSETYLKSAYTQPEWAAAFATDPTAIDRKLIPVRVKPCNPEGMLRPIVYVDLVDVPPDEAKQKILDMVKDRMKPDQAPAFPGVERSKVAFPRETIAAKSRVAEIKIRGLESRMNALEEDYNAVFEQLNSTLDAVNQKRLERQISNIEQEMEKIAQDLAALSVPAETSFAVTPINNDLINSLLKQRDGLKQQLEATTDELLAANGAREVQLEAERNLILKKIAKVDRQLEAAGYEQRG